MVAVCRFAMIPSARASVSRGCYRALRWPPNSLQAFLLPLFPPAQRQRAYEFPIGSIAMATRIVGLGPNYRSVQHRGDPLLCRGELVKSLPAIGAYS